MKKLLTTTILAAGLTSGPAALAYPNFPYVVASPEGLGMTCMPKCSLCHLANPGNAGNATQPFADNLLFVEDGDASLGGAGGASTDEVRRAPRTAEELIAALDAMSPDEDSDRDGIPDLTELTNSPPTDPNGLDPEICQPPTAYGCGAARVAPPARNDSQAWLPILLPLLGAGMLFGRWQKRRAGAR